MEGKFANHDLQSLDEDDDMLTATARELVTQKGVGEKADDIWSQIQKQSQVIEGARVAVEGPESLESGADAPAEFTLEPPPSESCSRPGSEAQLSLAY